MTETSDLLVYWAVVAARVLVPLAIPRYPLPGVVAALIIDAVDQTLFQQFTNLNLDGYQGYDKALDIYYLTIAYISTLRNWTNRVAFQVSRFLFYWRLVGVTLFELSQLRPLLLIFPNTFEYFFIFYEAYRLRWDPKHMTKKVAIGAAAVIWIVIKLPQEWWIHIAQLDTTDFIKEQIFGMSVDTPWSELISANLWVVPVAIAVVAIVFFLIRWLVRRLPPADRKPALLAGAYQPTIAEAQMQAARAKMVRRIIDAALVEKVALVALVSVIFAHVLPDLQASDLQVAVGVGFVVVINTALSHWLARRRTASVPILRHFFVMAVVNFALIVVYTFLLPQFDGAIDLGTTSFFALLLTLIVTLYDRYQQVYVAHFGLSELG
jgi:hypothetical protein